MTVYKVLRLSSLGMLFAFGSAAWAASTSSLSVEIGADNNAGRNGYISGQHKFTSGLQLSAGGGTSQATDSNGDLQTSKTWIFGAHTDTSIVFSGGLDISHAQQSDNLEIDSVILTLEINTPDWNLFLSPESREVSLTTNIGPQSIDFNSDGVLAGLAYYGWDPVYISASRSSYDYPSRISTIGSRPYLSSYVFGSDTVNQVLALEDERSAIEIGYLFARASLSFSHSRGRSAVDQSISTVDKIYLASQVSADWLIKLTVGKSDIDTSDSETTFASLGLSFQW